MFWGKQEICTGVMSGVATEDPDSGAEGWWWFGMVVSTRPDTVQLHKRHIWSCDPRCMKTGMTRDALAVVLCALSGPAEILRADCEPILTAPLVPLAPCIGLPKYVILQVNLLTHCFCHERRVQLALPNQQNCQQHW